MSVRWLPLFGSIMMFLLVAISASEGYCQHDEVAVRVFFQRDATNNPGGSDPNWYYYWSQTNASTGNHVYGGTHCPGNFGYFMQGENSFHVCNAATGTNPTSCPPGHTGIDTFAETCLHENTHLVNWWDWWGSGRYNQATDDNDGDDVPDTEEPALGLDPNLWDTDGDGWNDEHDLAYDAECIWTVGSADDEDWADPGHQTQ